MDKLSYLSPCAYLAKGRLRWPREKPSLAGEHHQSWLPFVWKVDCSVFLNTMTLFGISGRANCSAQQTSSHCAATRGCRSSAYQHVPGTLKGERNCAEEPKAGITKTEGEEEHRLTG